MQSVAIESAGPAPVSPRQHGATQASFATAAKHCLKHGIKRDQLALHCLQDNVRYATAKRRTQHDRNLSLK